MIKTRTLFNVLAVTIGFLLSASIAEAQATRTWVSGVGDDANPCSRTAPCKTFAGAISKTAAGGEISVLDPGGFGVVTITKSITINGEGTLAGIVSAGTNGIIVNAGVNDIVTIRNISIHGVGTGLNGIRYLAGGHLIVDHCWINSFSNHGIDASLASSGKLTVKDTHITDCDVVGVRMTTTSGTPTASLDNVRIKSCGLGFDMLKGKGTISRSIVSHVVFQAVVAENTAEINAESCVLSNNGTGVSAFSTGSMVRISNCDIFDNNVGITVAPGGTVASFQNNRNAGNVTPGAANATLVQN